MSKALLSLLLFFHFGGLYPQENPFSGESQDSPPSHARWDTLVRAHVTADGWVDYEGFLQDRAQLEAYLQILGDHTPGENWGREAQLAYFINLYNAATVLLILDHYPVGSIRDIPRPWGRKVIHIGPEDYSLGEVEHGILREMGDPRIHFAINCASVSCPKLRNEAFTAEDLDRQLLEATREFVNDPAKNRISASEASLSKIFKWYKKDFLGPGQTLPDYLEPYLREPIPADTQITFLPYDWSLNSR